jgi:hypothetical protein
VKQVLLKFALVPIFVIVALTGSAHASLEMERPSDPFANLQPGEKLSFMERERGLRYIALVAKYDVLKRMPRDYSIAHVMDVVRDYEPRFGDLIVSTPLALLNSVLYNLNVQYRQRTPVEFEGRFIDSPANQEVREFVKETARLVMSAIAKLPDQTQQIELEFNRQSTLSTPHRVLSSYLNPQPNANGVSLEPLFGGELEGDFQKHIGAIEQSRKFSTRFFEKLRSPFATKSCRGAFL